MTVENFLSASYEILGAISLEPPNAGSRKTLDGQFWRTRHTFHPFDRDSPENGLSERFISIGLEIFLKM